MQSSYFLNVFFLQLFYNYILIVWTNNPRRLVIGRKDAVLAFHDTFKLIDLKISFTIETESNAQIPVLDSFVTRINGIVAIQVYRKLTHTDRYLDLRTRHVKKHKTGAVCTLSNRASNLPSRTELWKKWLLPLLITKISKNKPAVEKIPSQE